MRQRQSRFFEVPDEVLLDYVLQGMTTKQIAAATGYSERTIRNHTQRLGIGNKDANHSQSVAESNFVERLNASSLGEVFEYAGGYETNRKRVTLRCKSCGYEYTPIAREINRGGCRKYCPQCEKKAKEANLKKVVVYARRCKKCSAVYFTQYETQEYCSHKCRERARRRRYRSMRPRKGSRNRKHLKRMRYYANKYGWPLPEYDRTITLEAVIEKHGNVCQVCGELCDRTLPRKQPTIDHVIELCLGGSHTWGNVRLACNECNYSRNKRLSEQRLGRLGGIGA